jgi:putative transposase
MMGDMEIPDELIDQLLGEYQGPEQLTGPDGLINQLRRRLIERAAGAELEQHLGYPPGAEPPEGQPNRRNGRSLRHQSPRRPTRTLPGSRALAAVIPWLPSSRV